MKNTLKELRKKNGFTLKDLAGKIGVSKQTMLAYERDAKKIPGGKISLLATIFETSCDAIICGEPAREYTYEAVPATTPVKSRKKQDFRISIPQENLEKFKEVLLYVLEKVGARPNVGKTVLYKILYFIDFDYFEKFETQLIGAKYVKKAFGPAPVDFDAITQKMKGADELSIVRDAYFNHEQTKYLPRREADLSLFSARELAHIDICLQKYAGMNATEISNYSHKDVPWIVAQDNEPLDYETVFYRTEETSVRTYGNDDDA